MVKHMQYAVFLALTAALSAPAQTVLLHAIVIDGTGSAPLPDAAIVISEGRINAIGPAAKVKLPAGSQVIDLTGKTIIPGIINAHSHISEDPAVKLRHFAQYGITSTIGMGGDGDDVFKIRDDQRHGEIHGARAYTVGHRFEFEKDAPTPDIARLKVEELYKQGVDAVKVVVDNRRNTQIKLRPEITAAVINEAHKRHMKTFAHIHDYDDAKLLMDQGIDMLAHQVRDREVDDAFINEMKAKKVAITSTLVRELSSFVYAESPAWLNDPFLIRFSDPARIELGRTQLKDQQSKLKDLALNRRDLEIASKNFAKMVSAGGIRIGLGTDSGPTPTRFEGFFEHLEMELMVKYGMTPMQVIQAFSKTNSEILGIDKDYGTLAKGKVADLVVLDKNPLDDILNTRTVSAVYIGGKKFE
ncbi:MAG: amidohydrolase family protein [Acidobacteriota bacterium]|nr:amidohydrolase family protein [Acidobacteriota bacterium]